MVDLAPGARVRVRNSGVRLALSAPGLVHGVWTKEGPVGPPGAANALSVGTVEAGDTPEATITGAPPAQVLNLVLPQGNPGPEGPEGPAGPPGAGSVSTVNGNPGPNVVLGATDVGASPANHTHPVQRAVFSVSGTWTKPAGMVRVVVTVIAGGGSGGAGAGATGGGGGGCVVKEYLAADVPGSSIAVTVGTGGLAPSGSTSRPGNPGGTSSFGDLVVTAGKGGGASSSTVGTGGGNTGATSNGGLSTYGGGAGGYVGSSTPGPGGNSDFGGGGGGAFGGAGGVSTHAGSGGAGSTATGVPGGNGVAPGGGGGTHSANNGMPGAGANGQVTVITYFA